MRGGLCGGQGAAGPAAGAARAVPIRTVRPGTTAPHQQFTVPVELRTLVQRRPQGTYSAVGLVGRGLTHWEWRRAWRRHDLRPAYDVVVIGAGVHGLATAYYLAAN